jgi:hypothetical protein
VRARRDIENESPGWMKVRREVEGEEGIGGEKRDTEGRRED